MQEIWKSIKNFEGLYECSNLGRVRSLNHEEPLILKLIPNNNGYLTVNLYKKGFKRRVLIHRLVAETFIPNPNNLPVVHHKTNNKSKNSIDDIKWVTHKENTKDAIDNGHMKIRGEDNKSSKLTWEQINNLREDYLTGNFYVKELCNKYLISPANVARILTNKSWYDKKYDNLDYINRKKIIHRKHLSQQGRGRKSKLTDIQILEIKRLYFRDKYSCSMIGKIFNLTRQAILYIIKNKRYEQIN